MALVKIKNYGYVDTNPQPVWFNELWINVDQILNVEKETKFDWHTGDLIKGLSKNFVRITMANKENTSYLIKRKLFNELITKGLLL